MGHYGKLATAALLLLAPVAADALTYTGEHLIEDRVVRLTINTDGTLGNITKLNFGRWQVDIFDVANLSAPLATMVGGNPLAVPLPGDVNVGGNGVLLATLHSLVLPYRPGVNNNEVGFYEGQFRTWYAIGAGGTFAFESGQKVKDGPLSTVRRALSTDDLIWVTRDAGPPAVPEPATWAMLIAGFSLVGAAARRRPARLPLQAGA